jgi:CheY-like chemotaxis protein
VEIGRALRVGVKDYYVKSTFQPENFLAKVAKLIESTNADASVITSTLLTDPTPQVSSTPAPSGTSDTATTRSLPKLLIVEDDKFLRELAVQKLSNANLSVISAMDGEQGLALAESEKPDMILLDILLPGIDGYEVLKRVRANPELKGTRISMLSNFGQREDIQKALSAGADQFMVKANYTLDEIVEEVKKMLSKPRA